MRTPRIEWVLPATHTDYELIEVDPRKLKPEPWNNEHLEQLRFRFKTGGKVQVPTINIAMGKAYLEYGDHCVQVAIEHDMPCIPAGVPSEYKQEILRCLNACEGGP